MMSDKYFKSNIIYEDIQNINKNVSNKSIFEDSKILITGANGMIASYLVYFFCYINDFILTKPCILYLVVKNKKRNRRIERFLSKPYVEIIAQDIAEPIKIDKSINYIIHAASIASPQRYIREPVQTINANILGLYNVLSLPHEKLRSLMFFSSSELYGNPGKGNIPTKESYVGRTNFHDIRSSYVESKRFGEVICINYFREFKTPIKIIRPFHVYSPEIDPKDKRIFASFVHSALRRGEIEINGDGKSTRTFCYITDAVIMILKILISDYNGEVFNIGNQKNEISVKNLANLIAEITNTNIRVKILNNSAGFLGTAPIRSCPDMQKTEKFLDFIPEVDLRAGFSRVIEYQRTQ